jgi:hypothetical protein
MKDEEFGLGIDGLHKSLIFDDINIQLEDRVRLEKEREIMLIKKGIQICIDELEKTVTIVDYDSDNFYFLNDMINGFKELLNKDNFD